MPASNSRRVTKSIGPKSTAETLMNIKALPQIAPRQYKRIQFFSSMIQEAISDQ